MRASEGAKNPGDDEATLDGGVAALDEAPASEEGMTALDEGVTASDERETTLDDEATGDEAAVEEGVTAGVSTATEEEAI